MTGAPAEALTPAEQALLGERLWRFLGGRAARYTTGESSSLPEDTARHLLEASLYVLEQAGVSGRALLAADLDAAFARGARALQARTARTRELWQRVCLTAPPLENQALRDTLRSIGAGFSRYDILFSAQDFPCSIDYPPALPVPESLRGIGYIAAYLESLAAENALLRPFSAETVRRLLAVYCRDWQGLLLNLCEPVVTNAVGLALLGRDIFPLDVTEADRAALSARFALLPESAARRALASGAGALCRQARIADAALCRYVERMADGLYPRIRAARLDGVFLSFPTAGAGTTPSGTSGTAE